MFRTLPRLQRALSNQLGRSTNLYLRSHKQNPVAWQEWSDESLNYAVKHNKPVFLSIGYHTCHWCHVMNRESFANESIAKLLNEHFVPIKVDREERPDVDSVYMMYLQATLGQGGWPLNVFLVPGSLEPFYGGTYWAGPGVDAGPRAQKFEDILNGVVNVWETEPEKCKTSARETASKLTEIVRLQSGNSSDATGFSVDLITDDMRAHFTSHFDPQFGGFSHEPKFPIPHNLSTLLKFHKDLDKVSADEESLSAKALFTLDMIGKGGIKDHIGHGFARYSVTHDWNLPHFEKMLYDQALLLSAYVDSWVYGNKPEFAVSNATDIVEFLVDGSLSNPSGGFFSAQDADSLNSEGEHSEGAYYVWTAHEFFEALKHRGPLEADICAMYWNVQDYGNVDPQFDIQKELQNQNVLSQQKTIDEVAKAFGKTPDQVRGIIESCREQLSHYRAATREPPEVDNKVVTSWNGLAISALARAGSILGIQRATHAAEKAATFILDNSFNSETKTLKRTAGSNVDGMNDDYANLISGLLDLYEATLEIKYLRWAKSLQEIQIQLFWDKEHGGFYSVHDQGKLFFRPKVGFDSAEPSANGVSAYNLLRLFSMLGETDYELKSLKTVQCYGEDLKAQPFGYCSMIGSVIAHMKSGMESIVVTGNDESAIEAALYKQRLKENPLTTIVKLNEDSLSFLSSFDNMTYREIYETYKDRPVAVLVCKDRSCEEVADESSY